VRPVLVISHDVFNERSGTVIALALTGRPQKVGLPLALKLENPRLPKPSWVKISQVRLLSTLRLGKRVGRVSAEEMQQVIEAFFELVA
jgi:mRNA interferase MazF